VFSTAEKMRSDLTSVMNEVSRYVKITTEQKVIDIETLDMNKVKLPQSTFDKVSSLNI
jgi:hypothetical protein